MRFEGINYYRANVPIERLRQRRPLDDDGGNLFQTSFQNANLRNTAAAASQPREK